MHVCHGCVRAITKASIKERQEQSKIFNRYIKKQRTLASMRTEQHQQRAPGGGIKEKLDPFCA
jgi:hypothetical protein